MGKSNFLDLLDTVFNRSKFSENDFLDENEAIEIDFSLIMDEIEIGFFDDSFDPEDLNKVHLMAKQADSEEFIEIFDHIGIKIKKEKLRCINFIKYDSLRKPAEELTFHSHRGVGKLLNFLIENSIRGHDLNQNFIDKDELDNVIEDVNEKLNKIKIFEEFDIKTSVENDIKDLIQRMLVINDSKDISINKIGHGVQFSVLIVLNILNNLMEIVSKRRRKNCIFESENGKNISLILGLDEPEMHLHPYRQRKLMNYLLKLINNEENEFSNLIKDLFCIDHIIGQAIVVTHSPNILSDDYRTISRFYKENDKLQVISGKNLNLEDNLRKHLLKNLPYVKEGFFSRCNILVEGDSEIGAFPEFFKRLGDNYDMDELGISVIQAGSADSIPPLTNLLDYFCIQSIGIMDNDKYLDLSTNGKIESSMQITSTVNKNFEEEIYDAFLIEDYIKFVELNDPRNKCFFMDKARNLGINIDCSRENVSEQIEDLDNTLKTQLKNDLKLQVCEFLDTKKSIIIGQDLAKHVSEIPKSYKDVIIEAKRLSNA